MTSTSQTLPEPGEIDVDYSSEVDSAVGDDLSSYTQSLRSSLLEGVKENGRQYHSYRSGTNYMFPEDTDEQDRLDLQHEQLLLTTGHKLILAPMDGDIHEVLDLGTGTGIWATEFADQHPEASVLGTDLSPIQPTLVPPNCRFVVDDFEEEWLFRQKFDLIHGRMLVGAMSNPASIFRKAFDNLKPGGWLEMQDVCLPTCDDNSIPGDSPYQQWIDLQYKALRSVGREWDWAMKYKEMMEEAGFRNVEQKVFKWPQNTWPKATHFKQLGAISIANLDGGLEGFSLRPFSGLLGMGREEIEVLLAGVRKDMVNSRIHAYWPM